MFDKGNDWHIVTATVLRGCPAAPLAKIVPVCICASKHAAEVAFRSMRPRRREPTLSLLLWTPVSGAVLLDQQHHAYVRRRRSINVSLCEHTLRAAINKAVCYIVDAEQGRYGAPCPAHIGIGGRDGWRGN